MISLENGGKQYTVAILQNPTMSNVAAIDIFNDDKESFIILSLNDAGDLSIRFTSSTGVEKEYFLELTEVI